MRLMPKTLVLTVLIISSSMGQQFYQSEGLQLFNQRQYKAAIDSMIHWADSHSSERGMVYFYVGESYYNLGLDETIPSQSVSHFKESVGYFEQAIKQADLISVYPNKIAEAKYKKSWGYYRLGELESNPLPSLESAYGGFIEVTSSPNDSLAILAMYMAGESKFRESVWRRIQMHLSLNRARKIEWAQESIACLQEAGKAFQYLIDSRIASRYLRNCARVRHQDVLFEWGKLYQKMGSDIFSSIQDAGKQATSEQTAIRFFQQIDYRSILDFIDGVSKAEFQPLIAYFEAAKDLNLYQLTGATQDRQRLNRSLDGLRWAGFRDEKIFLQGNRDQMSQIEDEAYIRLTDPLRSDYAMVANRLPEAWYWLGWGQFLTNVKEAENSFDQFLGNMEDSSPDPRLDALKEDAQYRIFLLRFDQHASNSRVLNSLKAEIEAFHPSHPTTKRNSELLLQLVRVGLGESIWGRILQAPTTVDRLRDAFRLIRNMMVRATRVVGQERVPYLNYLDKLFQITEDRRSQETIFYRGLAQFLRAEIQETADNKRNLYVSAGDVLKNVTGKYLSEGKYVQARSYFAAAKHESRSSDRNTLHERAQPFFIELINDAQSLRSVYYLGEIFRIRGNGLAARRCYEVVMEKTRGKEGGSFWYSNAQAGIDGTEPIGDTTQLNNINIDDVTFPEALLVEDGEAISLEKFADQYYIRRQYWEESIDLLMKYGLEKRTIYPSTIRPSASRFEQRAFGIVTAGIQERIGVIDSGLRLFVSMPAGVQSDITVSLDGVLLESLRPGIFERKPLSLNQTVEIFVECPSCYPFVERHRFTQPGVEHIAVTLSRKNHFRKQGEGIETGVNIVQFPERLDGNTILHTESVDLSSTTILFRDFQSNYEYRDYIYSTLLDGYLVVHSGIQNLLLYRNDSMVTKEGELLLIFSQGDKPLNSPEGIAIDSQGNIYVVDWGNHRICIFGRDGSYLRSFGRFGINTNLDKGKPIHFVYPRRIAITEDIPRVSPNGQPEVKNFQIFIVDHNGIHLMDGNGNYLDTVIPSSKRKEFYGLAVRGYGSNARLYVVDRKTGKIERFLAQAEQTR